MKPKQHGESIDLNDAISLAMAMVSEANADCIAVNALNHAAEIAKYDAKHPAVSVLKRLQSEANAFRACVDLAAKRLEDVA